MPMLPSRLRIRLISPDVLLVWSGCISEPDPSYSVLPIVLSALRSFPLQV